MALRYIEAITIRQPFATLVACGLTRFIPRAWGPKRGVRLLGIHAASKLSWPEAELCGQPPFSDLLRRCGYEFPGRLPVGKMLAIAVMVWPHRVEVICDRRMTFTERDIFAGAERLADPDQKPRWAWELTQVKRIREPIDEAGCPGLWQWNAPEDLLRRMDFLDMAETRKRDASVWIDV